MKKRILLVNIVAILITLFITGCGKKEENKDGENKVTVNIAQDSELFTMDSAAAVDGISFDILRATQEGLCNLAQDGKVTPGLASSYDVSEDGLRYTFHLREDAKWSNGDPLTADDFVFGWRRIVDEKTASAYSFIFDVAGIKNADKIVKGELPKEELGIKKIDDKTLEVTLERPTPFFLGLTELATFYPLNEKFYNNVGDQYALEPKNLLFVGPYKMVDWKKGYGYRLEKNENYYNKDAINVDVLNYRIIKDPQTAALKFDSGELDVVKLSAELTDKYRDSENFKSVMTKYLWYVSFNLEKENLKNKNLRKAISEGFDKTYITDSILKDGSVVANFLIPKGFAVGPNGKTFRSEAPEYLKYNKEEALEYWNKAKEEMGVDEVSVELLFDDFETVKKMAEYIQSQLETNLPGLRVTLKSQPKKNRAQLMFDGNYEAALTRWGVDYDDPQAYLEIFGKENTFNFPQYKGVEFNTLLENISRGELTLDPEKRWEAMKTAEKVLLDDVTIAPLYQRGNAFLIKGGITGIKSFPASSPLSYRDLKVAK